MCSSDLADLNAHNVLLDADGAVSVIDFDRGRLRAQSGGGARGIWATRNLERLRRSLAKISRGLPAGRYSVQEWEWLMAGYGAAAGPEAA